MTDLFARHSSTPVDPAKVRTDAKGPFIVERKICSRCGGDGIWKGHYNGVCYGCGGSGDKGTRTVKLYTAEKIAKLDASKAKRDAKRAAKNEAAYQAKRAVVTMVREVFTAEHPYIDGALDVLADTDFGKSIAASLEGFGHLTVAQIDAVVSAAQRETAKRAADAVAESVVEGRGAIAGEILSTKFVESQYGRTLKMLVRDDRGFKVWGSVPSALRPEWSDDGELVGEDPQKGDRVTFTATVTASDDDRLFGFFKRPTKAAIITTEAA